MADAKNAKSILEKSFETLNLPQKILMKYTAKAIGKEGSEDASKSAEDITEALAEKAGIPEDSKAGILAKTAVKTALDVGYDPLNIVGVGALSKTIKASKRANVIEKIVNKLKGAKNPELAKVAENYWKSQKASAETIRQGMKEPAKELPKFMPDEKVLEAARERFKQTEAAKASMDPETRKWLYAYEADLTPAEKSAQRTLDLNKEREARLAEPAKELEKTIDVAKLLKKK